MIEELQHSLRDEWPVFCQLLRLSSTNSRVSNPTGSGGAAHAEYIAPIDQARNASTWRRALMVIPQTSLYDAADSRRTSLGDQ
jgi:hypothetical protein